LSEDDRPNSVRDGTADVEHALPQEAGEVILKLDTVTVRYGQVTALADVNLEVKRGEIVALLGANGAGKSTVLRAISGLVPLASGVMTLGGRDLDSVPAFRRPQLGVAHVPEGRLVFADQSVEDNLRLGAYSRYFRPGQREIQADLERLLDRFPSLAQRRRIAAGSLSGGEQQQLAIARALMARPRLLLLDEPSLGLAPIVVDQVFDLVAALRREGVTVLLVEQLAYRALEMADRAYVLQTGHCVLTGLSAEVLKDPRLEAAYLGKPA
jgi:ABC-type branched-subunit amino acid transport system ATPase component